MVERDTCNVVSYIALHFLWYVL